jgi:NAD(P)-dependent dehydrogenase (short-subunit alcohol dehydrogenase family)
MSANTIVITGASGATASSLIQYFSEHYNNVIGISRNANEIDCAENVYTLKADISIDKEAEDAINEIDKIYGKIDCIINCAGGFDMGETIEESQYQWDQMHSINFGTCLNTSRAVIPIMKKNNGGCIINFGSRAALDGFANAAPYLVSKSAVHTLTKLTAIETQDNNIRCNAILPGIIDTPANRDAMPDEDFSQWETTEDIAKMAHRIIQSSKNGELITLNQEL